MAQIETIPLGKKGEIRNKSLLYKAEKARKNRPSSSTMSGSESRLLLLQAEKAEKRW
jgi:hypothetical protein